MNPDSNPPDVNPDTTPRPPDDDDGSFSQREVILAAVVPSLAILILIIVLLVIYLRYRRNKRGQKPQPKKQQDMVDPAAAEGGRPGDAVDIHSGDGQDGNSENASNSVREGSVQLIPGVEFRPDQSGGDATVAIRSGNAKQTDAALPTGSRCSSSGGSLTDDNQSRTLSANKVTCDDVDGPRPPLVKSPKNKQRPMSTINIQTGSSESLSRPADDGDPAAQPLLSGPAEENAPTAGTSGEVQSLPAGCADSLAGGALDDVHSEADTI